MFSRQTFSFLCFLCLLFMFVSPLQAQEVVFGEEGVFVEAELLERYFELDREDICRLGPDGTFSDCNLDDQNHSAEPDTLNPISNSSQIRCPKKRPCKLWTNGSGRCGGCNRLKNSGYLACCEPLTILGQYENRDSRCKGVPCAFVNGTGPHSGSQKIIDAIRKETQAR